MSMNSSSSPHGQTLIPKSASAPQNIPEDISEQRSQWISKLLSENPQLLALRERVLPWTGGYSFANVVHTDTTAVLSHVNRYIILELVFQHLNAIGMHRTAEMLQNECGHEFQHIDQPWDKTDLLLLVSLGVLPREDPWEIAPDPHHQYVEESLEEDFFASPYREDPKLIWQELLDPELNVQYEGATHTFPYLKSASMKRFVVLFATAPPAQLPDDELYKFFLTLHSITSSFHFFQHLCALFDCHLLEPDTPEQKQKILDMQSQLRVSVINLIKKWTSFHGLFIGRKTLKSIGHFLRKIEDDQENMQNIMRYAKPILAQLPNLQYGKKAGVLPPPCEPPIIDNAQIIFKPTLKLTEPNPQEVARQITLLFHAAFKAVHSREFVVALSEQKISHQTPTLAEFFDFGDRLTLLILDTIVNAPNNDHVGAISRFLDIAYHLTVTLSNFDAAACIMRALKDPEINNLFFLTDKDLCRRRDEISDHCGENSTKLTDYNSIVRSKFDAWKATIPNLRVELVSVPIDKTPSFKEGLINWEKRRGISEKTMVLYRFQNTPYNYSVIPQIQHVVNNGPSMTEKQIRDKIDVIRKGLNK